MKRNHRQSKAADTSLESGSMVARSFSSGFTKRHPSRATLILIGLITGVVGSYLLISSHAATITSSSEAEAGTLTGNASIVSDSGASGGSAVKFGSTGSCASTTHNIPDGLDPSGTCWPGPSNTGPSSPESSMSAYAGSCTITAPNTTIDSKIVNCDPVVVGPAATGLLIKNSYLKGGVIQETGAASFTVQDSFIDNGVNLPACTVVTIPGSGGQQSPSCPAGKYACGDNNNQTNLCGVGYKNFNIYRTEIINTNRAAWCESNCIIQDNYFHGTNLWPDYTDGAHASSVRNEQYLTLRHNSLACDYTGPFAYNSDLGCSADMSGYPDFAPIMHDTIDRNLFLSNNAGAGFCAYGGITNKANSFYQDPSNATYIVFTNNVFQKGANGLCGTWGAITDFWPTCIGNVWSGNKWDDGSVLNIGDAQGAYLGDPPNPLYCTQQ